MTDLHLIETPLDLRRLHEWAERRNFAGRGSLDEGHALHHLLDETFGRSVLKPFRVMAAPRARSATLFGYSDRPGDALRVGAATVATPGAIEVLDLGAMRSVPRPASAWREGQRLGFDLRARPVIRLARALDGPGGRLGKGAEVDAFLAEALSEHAGDRSGMARAERSREAVYLDWLAHRLTGVANLDRGATRLARFQRLRAMRGGKPVEGPEAIIHGTLTVTDPAAFADRLARGVGRHRAYGYGMLLLRPPGRRC